LRTPDQAVRPAVTVAPAERARPEGAVVADHRPRAGSLWQALAFGVQPKLAVSAPGDAHERDADTVADRSRVSRRTRSTRSR
jgi:hypothetical protein